jgi:hypothetical protein
MNSLFKKKFIFFGFSFYLVASSTSVFADGTAGVSNMLNFVFGSRQGLLDAASCTLTTRESSISPGWGAIGKVRDILTTALRTTT